LSLQKRAAPTLILQKLTSQDNPRVSMRGETVSKESHPRDLLGR